MKVTVAEHHFVCEASCVNARRSCDHKVPRHRARLTAVLRGSARSFVSAGSSAKFGGYCRCGDAQLGKSAGSLTGVLSGLSRTRLLGARGFNRLRQAHVHGGLTTASSAA